MEIPKGDNAVMFAIKAYNRKHGKSMGKQGSSRGGHSLCTKVAIVSLPMSMPIYKAMLEDRGKDSALQKSSVVLGTNLLLPQIMCQVHNRRLYIVTMEDYEELRGAVCHVETNIDIALRILTILA